MKTLSVFLAAITLAMVASSVVVFAFQATGKANLHQVGQSGVKARNSFLDSGSPNNQLAIRGTVKVVDPTQAYISGITYALQLMGSAKLRQINGSGVRARISFVDSGGPDNQLVIAGTARGLDPTKAYLSLVYDNGSVPKGPGACLPSAQNDLTGAQMFAGTWQVDANGNGTLSVTKTGTSYVPVSEIGAMSIRLADTRALQACGEVRPRCKEDAGQEDEDQ